MRLSAYVCLGLLVGCASARPVGIVPEPPALTLNRARYVLPPEPPPPAPRSVEEQRWLEAQWPEVKTYAVTSWPQARARQRERIEQLPACETPDLPLDAPCRGRAVHSARPARAQPVIVRVHNRRVDTLPMVLLEAR